MNNLYGQPKILTQSNYIAASTFQIQNDDFGILTGIIRLLSTAIKITKFNLNDVKCQNDVHKCWLQIFIDSSENKIVSVSQIQQLLPINIAISIKTQFQQIITSLPSEIQNYFFSETLTCHNCSFNENRIQFHHINSKTISSCQKCQTQLQITKQPILMLFNQNSQFPLRQNVSSDNYAFITSFSLNNYCFQLFSDFFCTNSNFFALSAIQKVQQQLQISDLTFLKANKALEWLKNEGTCMNRAGKIEFSVYFNLKYADFGVQQRVNQQYQAIEPQKTNTQYYSPQLKAIQQEVSVYESSDESDVTPLVNTQYNSTRTKGKTYSTIEFGPCVIIFIAFIIIFFFIDLVLVSFLTNQLKGTAVINNMNIQQQAFLGIPTIKSEADIQVFLNQQNVQNVQDFKKIQKLKVPLGSQFSVYTNQLYGFNLTSNDAVFGNSSIGNLNQTSGTLNLFNIDNLSVDNLTTTNLNVDQLTFNQTLEFAQNTQISGLDNQNINFNDLTVNQLTTQNSFATTATIINPIRANTFNSGQSTLQQANLADFTSNNLNVAQITINNALTINNEIIMTQPTSISQNLQVNTKVEFIGNSAISTTSQTPLSLPNINFRGVNFTINATTNLNNLAANSFNSTSATFANVQCVGCSVQMPSFNISGSITTGELIATNLTAANSNTIQLSTSQNTSILNGVNQIFAINSTGITSLVPLTVNNLLKLNATNISSSQNLQISANSISTSAPLTNFQGNANGNNLIFTSIIAASTFKGGNSSHTSANCVSFDVQNISISNSFSIPQVTLSQLEIPVTGCISKFCSSKYCRNDVNGGRICQVVSSVGGVSVQADKVVSGVICTGTSDIRSGNCFV